MPKGSSVATTSTLPPARPVASASPTRTSTVSSICVSRRDESDEDQGEGAEEEDEEEDEAEEDDDEEEDDADNDDGACCSSPRSLCDGFFAPV